MKDQIVYILLIILIIFLFFKKMFELVIDMNFPTYKPPPEGVWGYVVKIRDSISVFSIFFILGILFYMGRHTNKFITTILVLYLLYDILYFLFDWGYIFKFIPKTKSNEDIVKVFDIYLNSGMNVFLGLFGFFAIVFIFYK